MQQLHTATRRTPESCARELLLAVPLIMRFLRGQMRRHREELTVPQFRALVFIHEIPEASLSSLAEHVGVSLPAASRMADLLVKRGLIARQARREDRRSVSLSLSLRGNAVFRGVLKVAEQALAEQFGALSSQELAAVGGAMGILKRVFALGNDGHRERERNGPRRPAAAKRSRRQPQSGSKGLAVGSALR